ncbi:hypothetical protein [Nocardioides dongkuii]|nr:hypothetical protein [Nocardioides dongkuii]
MKEKWSARTHPTRFVVVLIGVTVACLLLGWLMAQLANSMG